MKLRTLAFAALIAAGTLFTSTVPLEAGAKAHTVASGAELKAALKNATPGDTILLEDGTYIGKFVIETDGTAAEPITLRGGRKAVLDGGDFKSGYALHLQADHWVLDGFTVTNAKKGIVLDSANHNIMDDLSVHRIGEEAVHLRTHSSHNTLKNSEITNTGLSRIGYGEGVYIGSAENNWGRYTDGKPDKSDHNKILNNHIGPDVRSENIDIKEGTTGGEVIGNYFDGSGMTGDHYDDSWIDLKGNGYLIAENTGVSTLQDGITTHVAVSGWGMDNVFTNNRLNVNASGYGISIQEKCSISACGNIIYDSNTVQGAAKGLTNIAVTKGGSDETLSASVDAESEIEVVDEKSEENYEETDEVSSSGGSQNLASEKAVVKSSGFRDDHALGHLFDGCTSGTAECTSGTDAASRMIIEFDLRDVTDIASVRLYGDTIGKWQSHSMDIAVKDEPGPGYKTIAEDIDVLQDDWVAHSLNVTGRYVRVIIEGSVEDGAVQVRELEIIGS